MKKVMIVVLAALLLCSGCGNGERPSRMDTVVWIPVNPTQAPAAEKETEIAQTESGVSEKTEPATEPEETMTEKKPSSTGKKPSSNKGSSNKNNSASKETKPKETEPEETKPESTKPPASEPSATEVTQPPETRPVETEPVSSQPPDTEPPETEPVSSEPDATEPPAAEPDVTEPETVPTEPEATEAPPAEPEVPLYDISGYVVGSLEYGIRDEINGAREENDLTLDSRLCAIASCRANEISRVWSHTRPDGRHYSTVLADYGYGAGSVTELLVYVTGQGDAASIVGKWLESDSHRENLLSAGYRTIGVGVYRSGGYTYVCCMLVS